MSTSAYEEYLAEEWQLFARDGVRQREARESVAALDVRHVLDVGCGGGQDLIPFATASTSCVGIDVSHDSGLWASRQFAATYPDLRVRFLTAAAETLPFRDGAFDLVLCRVAIPYTDNRRAMAEMGRVLRQGGILLLKTHAPRYYWRKVAEGLKRRSPLFGLHALRVLVTGAIYHVTGTQPRGGLLLRETFLTLRQLRRELDRAGLVIVDELSDSNPLTPSYRIQKVRH